MTTNETFYAFDALNNLWEPVRTKPYQNDPINIPQPRDEHTAVLYND
jgi:hypothetical protein